ncbi:SpoIIE family protein phosphatase [Streptomyces sp. B6B3]|uniref:SpoIIE family protein phosphatase n=1 Tax=Streptomyces sp. B6B3 TaxID=3153570 RepID=UPI00325D47C8
MNHRPAPLRSPLDELPVGIVVLDESGAVLLWGPMNETILGWSAAEVLGRRLSELAPEGGEASVAEVYREPLSGRYWRGSLALRHRDGHPVRLEGRGSLARRTDGNPSILAILAEAHWVEGIEQELAALDALFTASPLGMAIFDPERRYVRVNESLVRMDDTTEAEILGRTALDVLSPPLSQELHKLLGQVLDTGRPVTDLVTASPDGKGSRSVSLGQLTDRAGRRLGVSCTVMDITGRREAMAKVERAREELALLNDVGRALSDLLDVRAITEALARVLVPRYADYATVALLRPVLRGDALPEPAALAGQQLVRVAVGARDRTPAVDRWLEPGEELPVSAENVLGAALISGTPHLLTSAAEISSLSPLEAKARMAHDLGVHSMISVPLPARGTMLGLLTVTRAGRRAPFDQHDLTLTTELAARAGVSLDNARLYAGERERAVTLQHDLLPRALPRLPGVSVSHRYVPSGIAAEVGGDWFDLLPLAGGRVALVVGDVTGHGLRAAATMGRLRTAIRTLAALDLPPGELLRRMSKLSGDIARDPHHPLMATCVYAVYDPAARVCTLARAGHLPPVLFAPDPGTGLWGARPLDLPSGTPLGVDSLLGMRDGTFEERSFEVPRDAVLVLYTDGLIESRGEDIGVGLRRLCTQLTRAARPGGPLEPLCDDVIATLRPEAVGPPHGGGTGPEDDIALLVARLDGLPGDAVVSRTFPARRQAVRAARHAVRRALDDWGLGALAERAELLVSELVTNAVRHADGPIGLRMVRGGSLLVEVTDAPSGVTDLGGVPMPEPARGAALDDEGDDGLPLVAVTARLWGTRRGPDGRTVWFELALPDVGGPDPP